MPTAFVFPGQASQYVGMGRDLWENYPLAQEVFNEADEALGFSLSQLCFTGPEADLQLTTNTQPAILVVSIAAYRVLTSLGIAADYVAGHSLGEYSALVAAGSLKLADAVRLVYNRGRYMQEAVPLGVGAMAAIIGADLAVLAEICQEVAGTEVCSTANLNSPNQAVIAGHKEAVERAIEALKARKAGKAKMLPVSAPFHCDLMKPAAERLALDLAEIEFGNLEIPLVNNVDARIINRSNEVADSLLRQVCAPVRWNGVIQQLIDQGVTRFIEVGPKKVLTGLIKQINNTVEFLNVEDRATIESIINS